MDFTHRGQRSNQLSYISSHVAPDTGTGRLARALSNFQHAAEDARGNLFSPQVEGAEEGFGTLGGGGSPSWPQNYRIKMLLHCLKLIYRQHLLRLMHRVEVVGVIGDKVYKSSKGFGRKSICQCAASFGYFDSL